MLFFLSKSHFLRKVLSLVTLHKGKWEENGTITNNRSATDHKRLENPGFVGSIQSKIANQ